MNKLMRPKDRFTVGLRLLGVWMLLESLGKMVSGLELHFRLIESLDFTARAYVLHACADFCAAAFLVRCRIGWFWPDPDFEDPRIEVIPLKNGDEGSKVS